jgi:hypothetical protein
MSWSTLSGEDLADADEEGVGLLGYVYLTRRGLDRDLDWLGGLGTARRDGNGWFAWDADDDGAKAMVVGLAEKRLVLTSFSRLSCLVPCVVTRED